MKEKITSISRIFIPLILGIFIGLLIKNSLDYENLIKPILSPPKRIFPIVWSILYLLMGLSYYLYRKENNNSQINILYYSELFLNLIWPIIFFVLKWYLFSIFWILILLFTVSYLTKLLWIEKRISAYLFIPYLLWILFATYLNIGIYLLN